MFPVPPAHHHMVLEEEPSTFRFMFSDGWVLDVTSVTSHYARGAAAKRFASEHGNILNLECVVVPNPETEAS